MYRRPIVLAFAVLLIAAMQCAAAERIPAPREAELAKANKLIADIYESEYENAKTDQDRAKLAQKMIESTDDLKKVPRDYYAVLLTAARVARNARDAAIVFQSLDKISESFEVPRGELVAELSEGLPNDAGEVIELEKLSERTAKQQDNLADAWWAYGKKTKTGSTSAKLRAARMYRELAAKTSGITKLKAEKRLREMQDELDKLEGWVDLLAKVDVKKHAIAGEWKKTKKGIEIANAGRANRIGVPFHPEGNYTIRMKATRIRGGENQFGIIFPVRDEPCMLHLKIHDKEHRFRSKLREMELPDGVEHTVEISITNEVDKSTVEIKLNGHQFISWQGSKIELYDAWRLPSQYNMAIAAGAGNNVVFSELKTRRLDSGR